MLRLVDLSMDIQDRAPTFSADPETSVVEHLKTDDLGYNITELTLSTHLGTHLDAPFHFYDDGRTVDQLDVRRGLGPAWVLDFSHKEPKEEITIEELEAHGDKIGPGSRLLIYTGWDKVFPDQRYFEEQPMISVAACEWLAEKRVGCVGFDTPTINYDYIPAHRALLAPDAEVLLIEGLAHLDELQEDRVILIALPLRIKGRDGSPFRAMAIEGDIEPLVPLFDDLEFEVG